MPALGVCVIPENMTITYVVNTHLNYYICQKQNSTLVLKSKTGQPIDVNYNIWGPGNLNISCSANMHGSIGVYPGDAAIQGLPVYTYTQSIVEELWFSQCYF